MKGARGCWDESPEAVAGWEMGRDSGCPRGTEEGSLGQGPLWKTEGSGHSGVCPSWTGSSLD